MGSRITSKGCGIISRGCRITNRSNRGCRITSRRTLGWELLVRDAGSLKWDVRSLLRSNTSVDAGSLRIDCRIIVGCGIIRVGKGLLGYKGMWNP